MKIQNLAVIFIIIILPISLILTAYTQNQVKTLGLQVSYDSKLNNATYDALKAFQLNTFNSDASDLSNSKIRDVEASANTFFTSLASNFNMSGYNQDILKDYVPALVYTMYDGYYIYSPYTNKLTPAEQTSETYKNNDKIYGLKPYVYYSCRYKKEDIDVVITYTLDNYITVQGTIGGNPVYNYGYLLDNIMKNGDSVAYREISIVSENLTEYFEDSNEELPYVKKNGVKYYKKNGKWYSKLNGTEYIDNTNYDEEDKTGQQYYKDASDFKKWMQDNGIDQLTAEDAVYEDGNKTQRDSKLDRDVTLAEKLGENSNYKIFDFGGMNNSEGSIEDPDSNFNQHRLAVIRYSIEKNLSIAIANYNNYTGVETNFLMPQLKEDEWSKIINNISIISFLQGLNIGGKVYNGYSIINNTKNEEYVSEDSIYIADKNNTGNYYKINDNSLTNNDPQNAGKYIGVLNTDFERRTYIDASGTTKYFFPKKQLGSYNSIIDQSNVETIEDGNIYKYIGKKGYVIAQIYYTALGRERYSMYRTNNEIGTLSNTYNYKAKEYKVKYDANRGTGAPAEETKIEGKVLTLSSQIPIRNGYTFKGWSEDRNAKVETYKAGGTYNKDDNTTLYAVWWKNIEYTVSGDQQNKGANLLDGIEIDNYGETPTKTTTIKLNNSSQDILNIKMNFYITNNMIGSSELIARIYKNGDIVQTIYLDSENKYRNYDNCQLNVNDELKIEIETKAQDTKYFIKSMFKIESMQETDGTNYQPVEKK